MNRVTRLCALVLLPLALLSCGGDDDAAAPTEPGQVDVVDNEFVPDEITVEAGDTVTWQFEGSAVHNVVSRDDEFHSENKKDGTFEHTFEEAGEYEYVCTLHPGMNGTVVVE